VEIAERGESGRATVLSFSGTGVSANALRIALGSTKFRSTVLEQVEWDGNVLRLRGRGYGHGVGMSQWGASAMAQGSREYPEILAHYYPGTELTGVWE